MIRAFINKKVYLEKGHYEDVKTASIIGVLKNLPAPLFWELLKKSCADNGTLPENSGEIISYDFWPRWTYKTSVEPDVFIRFEEFDLIIEAKREDKDGQDHGQWEREIIAYFSTYYDFNKPDRKVVLIALGGSPNMVHENINTYITIEEETAKSVNIRIDVNIYKCNWYTLLRNTSHLQEQMQHQRYWDSNRNAVIRLLEDAIIAFNYQGLYDIDWLDSILYKGNIINEDSIRVFNNWRI